MNNVVITELYLAARLYRSGLLKYFTGRELNFYITDFCYNHRSPFFNDRPIAKRMIDEGLLKVVSLDEEQMIRVSRLYNHYKPRFVVKTITAIVYANDAKFRLFSDDDLLREVAAADFGVRAVDKEWLMTTLINDISFMGEKIDTDLIRQIL